MHTYAALIGLLCICFVQSSLAAVDPGLTGRSYPRIFSPFDYLEPGLVINGGERPSPASLPGFYRPVTGKTSPGYGFGGKLATGKGRPTSTNYAGKLLSSTGPVKSSGQVPYSRNDKERQIFLGLPLYDDSVDNGYRPGKISKADKLYGKKKCRAERREANNLAFKLAKCHMKNTALLFALYTCYEEKI